jgi:hypothetical protein
MEIFADDLTIDEKAEILEKYPLYKKYIPGIHDNLQPLINKNEDGITASVNVYWLLDESSFTTFKFRLALIYDQHNQCISYIKYHDLSKEAQMLIYEYKIEYFKYIKNLDEEVYYKSVEKDLNCYFETKKKSKRVDALYSELKEKRKEEFKSLNENELIKLINKNQFNLLYINEITDRMYNIAIKKSANQFGKVSIYLDLDRKWIKLMLKLCGNTIRHINKQDDELQMIAIESNRNCIRYIKNTSEKMQFHIIQNYLDKAQYLRNLTPEAKELYDAMVILDQISN